MFTRASRNRIQGILAWTGLGLMAVSVIWLQSLPPGTPSGKRDQVSAAPEALIKRVIIDAGHGGSDSGAMRDGVSEKDLTLDVARRLDLLLQTNGIATLLTRTGDQTVSLVTRAEAANQERDCIFVSIHFDEGSRAAATGIQTYYAAEQRSTRALAASWWPFSQPAAAVSNNFESQSLASFIQEALVGRTQAFNRGTRAEQFYVLANVRHPAVLIEGGFLSNNDDILKLTRDEYRQQLAVAISDGIMRYREITNRPTTTLAATEPGS